MVTPKKAPEALMGQSAGAYPVAAQPSPVTAQDIGQRRPRQNITDVNQIERALQLAAVTLKPDELSGRQLIQRLMPHLYALRKKGFSFIQLTRVLNDAIGQTGAKLQVATVKAYYNEFILERQDECQAQLADTMKIVRQVEALTKTNPNALVAEAVSFSKTLAATQENTAASRLLEGKNQRPALTGGEGMPQSFAPPPAAEIESRPPTVSAPPPPVEAAVGKPQMGIGGVQRGAAEPRPTSYSAGAVDDLPIPPLAPAAPAIGVDPTVGTDPVALVEAAGSEPATNTGTGNGVVCITQPTPETILPADSDTFDDVPQAFWSDAVLEHPGINGLMLTKQQRMYNSRLEYRTPDGEILKESVQQMRKRVTWKGAQPVSESRTGKDHVSMNPKLFGQK